MLGWCGGHFSLLTVLFGRGRQGAWLQAMVRPWNEPRGVSLRARSVKRLGLCV